MKIVAIWTQSLDGFIAKSSNDNLGWGKKADKRWFSRVTREMGVVVMGRKTAELIGKPLPGRLNVVMSRSLGKTPKQILEDIEKKGYRQVAIGGGASIYKLFAQEKLLDEIWVSVQPLVFGQGIRPVEGLDISLELISQEVIDEGVVVLKYRVMK